VVRRFFRRLAQVGGVLLLLGLIAVGGWYILVMSMPWSLSHCFEGEFAELPPSDEPLEAAILRTEGVIDGAAHVERDLTGRKIRIWFGTGGDMWNRPPLPDLSRLCREHGYMGQVGEFRQVRATDPPFP
jgi:hypothetical protein